MKTNEPGVLFGLSLKVTLALVVGIVSLIVVLLHIFIPNARDEISFATAVIGGAAVVYGGYYAGVSVRVAMQRAKADHSFQMLNALNSIDMAKIRILIENEIYQKDVPPAEVYDRIVGDNELLSAVTTIFGLWEDVSIGVRLDYLDEDVLFYSLSFLIPWHFENLKQYIYEERKRNSNPHVYIEMEKLADAWKNDKSLLTGKAYTWAH